MSYKNFIKSFITVFAVSFLFINANWYSEHYVGNKIDVNTSDDMIEVKYDMPVEGQWVQIYKNEEISSDDIKKVNFSYLHQGPENTMEIKLVDGDGSNFRYIIDKELNKENWSDVELKKNDFKYCWGGDETFNDIKKVYIAISGEGKGTLKIRDFNIETLSPKIEKLPVDIKDYVKDNWDNPDLWETSGDNVSKIKITKKKMLFDDGLEIEYSLQQKNHGFVEFKKKINKDISEDIPICFIIKANGTGDLEIKFIDKNGSIFWKKVAVKEGYSDWKQMVVYKNNVSYGWGGADDKWDGLDYLQFAISGHGSGKIYMDEIGFGKKGLKATLPLSGPQLDPNREMEGFGWKQRRHKKLLPEDPLILEWLKQLQDISSPRKQLLPSEEVNQAQTFNNALVAMAFMVKDEKERAERILDFYADATEKNNEDPTLQNFYYKGEARGFFQYVELNKTDLVEAYHHSGNADRWMGDMAWLYCAFKFHEKKYDSNKYKKMINLIEDLLLSWYTKAGNGEPGGYVRHGWRKGDKYLHEKFGHPEGNIDAYAVFKLMGEDEKAAEIKKWLDYHLKGNSMPLDLYTWRVLAYGKSAIDLLNIPEYDFRYRKILNVNPIRKDIFSSEDNDIIPDIEQESKKGMGFYPFPDIQIDNIWFDGTGHIACAYINGGKKYRGYFYANQLDKFIIERNLKGKKTHAIPYTANNTGEYSWVNVDRGFISVAAWYIFAKNGFNPLKLEFTK